MKLIPGYKQTEVGIIPYDWEAPQVGSIARIATGNTPSTNYLANYGDDFLFVSPADIGKNKYIIDTQKKLSIRGYSISRSFPEGSILFVCIGSTIGKCGIAKTHLTSNQQINAIMPAASVFSEYLYYALCTVSNKVKALASEQAVPIVSKKQFSETPIPLPPLPEQRAIAEALSDVDALIEAQQKLIAKKRDLKQAAMQQLLNGKHRLPGFSGEWEVKRLGEIAEIVSGGTPDTKVASLWGGSINWCTPTDITGCSSKYIFNTEQSITVEGLAHSSAQLLPIGTLLLCSRATIGEVRIAGCEVCTNQGFKSLVCNPCVYNEFVYYKLLTMKATMIERSIGSTFLEISKKDTAALDILVPPLPEQTAIASVLSDMDTEIDALEKQCAKTRDLKQGMMQQLLTGKIRLV